MARPDRPRPATPAARAEAETPLLWLGRERDWWVYVQVWEACTKLTRGGSLEPLRALHATARDVRWAAARPYAQVVELSALALLSQHARGAAPYRPRTTLALHALDLRFTDDRLGDLCGSLAAAVARKDVTYLRMLAEGVRRSWYPGLGVTPLHRTRHAVLVVITALADWLDWRPAPDSSALARALRSGHTREPRRALLEPSRLRRHHNHQTFRPARPG